MGRNPFRTLFERLLLPFQSNQAHLRSFAMDQELLTALQGLAEQEQRSTQEVAQDLLAFALAQQNISRELLQRWQALSPREQQVTALVCLNLTNRQIAARLNLAPDTIKTYVRNILYKFDLHSKAELRLHLADWDFSEWDRPLR